MYFSTVVEVAIGLITIYLVLSLLVSEIQELLSTILQWRARNLKTAIVNLLSGNPKSLEGLNLVNSLYQHPLIQSLHQRAAWRTKTSVGPSYLPSDAFAIALLFVLSQLNGQELTFGEDADQLLIKLEQAKSSQQLPEQLIENLQLLLVKAKSSLKEGEDVWQKFKEEISLWFDQSMERASGVYTRNTRGLCFVLGLVLSFLVNANSIHIVQALSQDRILQSTLSNLASQVVADNTFCFTSSAAEKECMNNLKEQVNTLLTDIPALPLGRSGTFPANLFVDLSWEQLVGWLLTGVAVSRGAAFWFDFLTKVVGFRNTGAKPSS
ncbi:MAG: hypothetical protein KME13_22155 [Myxacorys californica WJT36-NPBG1]|nr:hypothetical protein [Myxacorys californica WJT36-NPBG1]